MAERRMFAKTIVLSDEFLDMPLSARCLYFTLGMFADDDGFVNSPKGIMRHCGASQDDMKLLIAKKFVLLFESGVIVIKHWRINNYLRNDRHQDTKYIEEKSQLVVNDNGSYSFGIPNSGIPSIDKNSIDKDSIDKDSIDKNKGKPSFQDEELDAVLKDFIEMRNKIKKPMTNRAIEMLIKKVKELSPALPFADEEYNKATAKAIMEQSIEHSWSGVYPLKLKESEKKHGNRSDKEPPVGYKDESTGKIYLGDGKWDYDSSVWE